MTEPSKAAMRAAHSLCVNGLVAAVEKKNVTRIIDEATLLPELIAMITRLANEDYRGPRPSHIDECRAMLAKVQSGS